MVASPISVTDYQLITSRTSRDQFRMLFCKASFEGSVSRTRDFSDDSRNRPGNSTGFVSKDSNVAPSNDKVVNTAHPGQLETK